METFNLFNGETDLEPDGTEPPGYLYRAARLWTDEEWLIVVAGTPTLRTPEGERHLESGDVACFSAGPDGARHVRNDGGKPARVAMLSTKSEVGIAEYPDSDKVGVWAGHAYYMLRRSDQLDYWDGER